MTWLQIINEIFDIFFLSGVLLLLWLIWRNSVMRTTRAQQTLIELAMRDSASAQQAVESTRVLAESVHALIAIMQSEQKESPDELRE